MSNTFLSLNEILNLPLMSCKMEQHGLLSKHAGHVTQSRGTHKGIGQKIKIHTRGGLSQSGYPHRFPILRSSMTSR